MMLYLLILLNYLKNGNSWLHFVGFHLALTFSFKMRAINDLQKSLLHFCEKTNDRVIFCKKKKISETKSENRSRVRENVNTSSQRPPTTTKYFQFCHFWQRFKMFDTFDWISKFETNCFFKIQKDTLTFLKENNFTANQFLFYINVFSEKKFWHPIIH